MQDRDEDQVGDIREQIEEVRGLEVVKVYDVAASAYQGAHLSNR